MKRICLVSCVKTKRQERCPASELYISHWFRKARVIAERDFDRWFILSAKYALVEPHEVLEPYEETLKTMSKDDRWVWSLAVAQEFHELVREKCEITIFAGAAYKEMLVPLLKASGHTVEMPMECLSSTNSAHGN